MKEKEKIKSACEESDRKERIDKIASILKPIKYTSETERANAISSFVKSPMTTEEIEKIIAPGKPNYMSGQIDSKGVF